MGSILSVAFASDGQQIVSGSSDKSICVCNVETGEMIFGSFKDHTGSVLSIMFSSDDRWIVSGSSDKSIRIWNAETGEMASGPFEGHTGSVGSVTFSSDGRRDLIWLRQIHLCLGC
jgi:WD40 repeat protein